MHMFTVCSVHICAYGNSKVNISTQWTLPFLRTHLTETIHSCASINTEGQVGIVQGARGKLRYEY
jgi:hypothetical protein